MAATIHHPTVKTADRPHPSGCMSPERFARWSAALEFWAAVRGLPPEPWL